MGLRCGVALKSNSRPQQAFFQTNTELATFLNAASLNGWDAYHACSTYAQPERKAEHAHAMQSFWLDVDAGEGKPYANARAAIEATLTFAHANKLPFPTLVSSGYGVHAYWILDAAIAPGAWLPVALGLKKLCQASGFAAGPERTADAASILRTPGTMNYKRGSVAPVQMMSDFACVSYQTLAHLAHEARPARAAPAQNSLAAAASNIHAEVLADADRIADRCKQLDAMRKTKGLLPEPLWHACMGVLTHCEDGEDIAHEWSQGDARYSEDETQRKFDLAKKNTGPTTCARFAALNLDGCAGCLHANNVTTPVQLGRAAPQAVQLSAAGPQISGETLPALPDPFSWLPNGGVGVQTEKKNGEPETTVLCRSPVYLQSAAKGEIRHDDHFYAFRRFLPNDGWETIEIPAATMWGNQGLAQLGGKGILIENGELFRKFVRDSVTDYHTRRKMTMMYEQLGWKDNDTRFLVGDRLYGPDGIEIVTGSGEIKFRIKSLACRPGGSLEAWKTFAHKLFGIGREAQSFAVLAAFGAPLMRFLASDEGGAIISLVSRTSGKGKSTAMAGATTVWGEPDGVQLVNIDTQVAKGITFAAMGQLPIVIDELAAREPDRAREFVEIFTNGRDKMRGTQDGQIRHVAARWQTMLITASNVSLIDTIRAAGGSDAITYRVLEVPLLNLPAHVHVVGDQLKAGMFANWGYAGDFYMRYLVRPDVLEWAKRHVVKAQQQIIEENKFRAEHRFWARALACCTTAGIMCQQIGLLDFDVKAVLDWVISECRDQVGNIEESSAEQETAEGVLSAFLNERVSETLVMSEAWRPNQPTQLPRMKPMHKLTVRYNVNNAQVLIVERELRAYLSKREFMWREFCAELKARNIMTATKRLVNLGAGTDIPSGAVHCAEINVGHPAMNLTAKAVEYLAIKEKSNAAK